MSDEALEPAYLSDEIDGPLPEPPMSGSGYAIRLLRDPDWEQLRRESEKSWLSRPIETLKDAFALLTWLPWEDDKRIRAAWNGDDAAGLIALVRAQQHSLRTVTPSNGLIVVSAASFLAEQPRQVPWTIEHLKPAIGVCGTYAMPKAGKTMRELQLALAVADPSIGSVLAGQVVRHGSVLFAIEEGSRDQFRERLRRLSDGSVPADLHLSIHQRLRVDDRACWARLRDTVADLRPVALTLDPFAYLHSRDENKPSEMAVVMRELSDLATEFELCLTIIHHLAKPTERTAKRPSDRIRGAGAIAAGTDVNLVLERQDQGVRLWAEFRDAENAELFLVQDPDTLRFAVSDEPVAPASPRPQKLPLPALLAFVRGAGHVVAADVMKKFSVARNTAKARLEEAAEVGLLDSAQSLRGGLSYFAREA